jgi:hypothetical protein
LRREFAAANWNVVDRITVEEFRKFVPGQCDAILMDPPFGFNGWTVEMLGQFIATLKPSLHKCFLVCWADPDYFQDIVQMFKTEQLVFCDSMAVELLDGFGRPRTVNIDSHGLPRSSRMALMFRTNDIVRSDLKQQRVKETGFGITALKGKTYGRMSMPMTIHNILEVMLPARQTGERVFVELWPNFFDRRRKWVLIDERGPTE